MRFATLGGNWDNGSDSGSRNVNTNTATNSNSNNGGRGVCDDVKSALAQLRLVKPTLKRGQPVYPASANKLLGLAERGVAIGRNMEPALYYG